MTKEPDPEFTEEEPTKLVLDKPSDFVFRAAYLAYSEIWDRSPSQEVKKEVNEIMLSLYGEEMSYTNFYGRLDQFRRSESSQYPYHRTRIETQRKRDWRKKETKKTRNARHKGRS
jgi:hypothetical protein